MYSRSPATKAWILLRSIYQHPSPQSHGRYVVLSSPKPIIITTSYELAKAELGCLRDTIMYRDNTEDYNLIISRWTRDNNGVDFDITPRMGELKIEVRLRIEEADVAVEKPGLGEMEADVITEIREIAAVIGKQNDVGEGSYWRGPMDGYEGTQCGRSGLQKPQPEDKDPDVGHYDFASTRLRKHTAGEEDVPSLFTLGVGGANTTALPRGFSGSSIDGRLWTTRLKEEN